MENRLVMLYGGHGVYGTDYNTVNNDYNALLPILKKVIIKLKNENIRLISIIEYLGPLPEQIPCRIPRGNWFNTFNNTIRAEISNLNLTGSCGLGIPLFHAVLGRYLHREGIELVMQEPSFEDWRYYINNFPTDGNDRQGFVEAIKEIELGFINQIKNLASQNNNISFVNVRGDFHSYYYKNLKSELSKISFKVRRIDYSNNKWFNKLANEIKIVSI